MPGDFDLGDTGQSTAIDVDLADFAIMQNCFGQPADTAACDLVDLNNDFAIGLADYDHFTCALIGPDLPPAPPLTLAPLAAWTALPSVTITGTAAGAAFVQILGGAALVTVPVSDCQFSAQVPLSPGMANNFTLYGVFWNNVLTPPTHGSILHVLPPPAPTLNPHTTMTNQSVVTVTGTAPQAVSISVNAPGGMMSGIGVTDGAFTANVMLAPDQVNQVYFTATNAYGLDSAPTATAITHDAQPPELFIDFPADGASVTTPNIDVAGRVSDMLSGFMGLTVTVTDVVATVNIGIGTNGTYLAPAVPLAIGPNTLTAVATDILGNASAREIVVTRVEIPEGAPTMTLESGNGQAAEVNSVLPLPITVRVLHGNGLPFYNKVVTFNVTQSNGRLTEDPPGDEPARFC